MIKIILGIIAFVILVAIIGYIVIAVSASSSCNRNEASKMPDIESPYYLVTTVPHSLVYAAKSVKESDTRVILEQPYYVKMGGEWKFRDGENTLMRSAYKEINIKLLSSP